MLTHSPSPRKPLLFRASVSAHLMSFAANSTVATRSLRSSPLAGTLQSFCVRRLLSYTVVFSLLPSTRPTAVASGGDSAAAAASASVAPSLVDLDADTRTVDVLAPHYMLYQASRPSPFPCLSLIVSPHCADRVFPLRCACMVHRPRRCTRRQRAWTTSLSPPGEPPSAASTSAVRLELG